MYSYNKRIYSKNNNQTKESKTTVFYLFKDAWKRYKDRKRASTVGIQNNRYQRKSYSFGT